MKHVELEKVPCDDLFTVRIAVQGHDVFYKEIKADNAGEALRIAADEAVNRAEVNGIKGGMPWRV